MQNNKKTTFSIVFDGQALENHEINVKDLAPALLSLGELFEETNRQLNGESIKTSINIRATQAGSVQIDLSIVQSIFEQTVSLFTNDKVAALVNAHELLSIIGIGGGGGLIGLLKWLKNRKIDNVIKLQDGRHTIELTDGETRIVEEKVISVFRTLTIRKSLEAVVRTTLQKEGIEKLEFKTEDDHDVQSVTKQEGEYFVAPEVQEVELDKREIQTNIQLININFAEGKWKVNDGNATFWCNILDNSFLERIKKNEVTFAKDDRLEVILLRTQKDSVEGIKTDYSIKKVIKHRSAAIQLPLPLQINSDKEKEN